MEIQDSLPQLPTLGYLVYSVPHTCQSTLQVELAEPIVEPSTEPPVPHGENPNKKYTEIKKTPKWAIKYKPYEEPQL